MKKFLPVLFLLACISCKKDPPAKSDPMQFLIQGLPDTVTVEQVDTAEITFAVAHNGGNREVVTLQINGLPSQAGALMTPSVDTPSFNSVLRFVTTHTALGTYRIALTASTEKATVSDSLILKVIANPVNPAAALAGVYTETGPCSVSGNVTNQVTVAELLPQFNKIRFTGIWGGSQSTVVNADIDPQNHTINIPAQTINAANFSGTGTYTANQMLIRYKVVTNFATDSCNVVLSR